jgi:transposase
MQQKQTTQGLKNKRGRSYQYELSFIRMVVREYHAGKMSQAHLAQKHNISTGQLKGWAMKFSADISREIPAPIILTEQESQDLQVLKKQNDALEKMLSLAQMKITGLELMIDIAEEELNIEIRKKPGTKQSEG